MTKRRFKVNRAAIHYLRTTLESYDGMALVSTVEPLGATIEIQIAPGCENIIESLITHLKFYEQLAIDEVL